MIHQLFFVESVRKEDMLITCSTKATPSLYPLPTVSSRLKYDLWIVFIGHRDLEYQNTSTVVSASWHGFTDVTSGVAYYTWCVGYTDDIEECGVLPWRQVGLHTDSSIVLDAPLSSGYTFLKSYSIMMSHPCHYEGNLTNSGFVLKNKFNEDCLRIGRDSVFYQIHRKLEGIIL